MNIEKKSLQHVSKLLSSIDIRPISIAIDSAIIGCGINDDEIRTIIHNKLHFAIAEQLQKVNEAKDWVDTLIKDLK